MALSGEQRVRNITIVNFKKITIQSIKAGCAPISGREYNRKCLSIHESQALWNKNKNRHTN